MKIKTLVCALCATTVLGSCSFDDGELWNAVNSQEERLSALEKWQKTVETQLGALQGIISATDYVTGVEAVEKDGVKGYKISFLHAQPITLYYNEGGEISGSSSIGVAQEEGTNKYYWTMDGEALMVDGKKVYVSGNDEVTMTPNATNPENFDLTIGDYSLTIGPAVGAHPIKDVKEEGGKVIITLNGNTKKELVKYVDFSGLLNENYENPAGKASYTINLPAGFLMEALNVPSDWEIAVVTEGGKTMLKVTYPATGSAKVKFIISDGQSLSVIKETTFTVGKLKLDWTTVAFSGSAIQIADGIENVKVTGTTVGLPNAPQVFGDNICKILTRNKSVKHVDLSEFEHTAAISANAFYVDNGTGVYNETLETIILPKGFAAIWGNAFKDCKALKTVVIQKTELPAKIMGTAFDGCSKENLSIYVPENLLEGYKTLEGISGKLEGNLKPLSEWTPINE